MVLTQVGSIPIQVIQLPVVNVTIDCKGTIRQRSAYKLALPLGYYLTQMCGEQGFVSVLGISNYK